jgi:hypothetical protein
VKYNSKIYLKLIVKDNNCHNKYNSIIAAFIYDFESHSKYYYNFSHGDIIADTTFELFKKEIESGNYIVYVNNKKTYDKSSEQDWSSNPINDILKEMGVCVVDGQDEFDTIGLGKYRTNIDFN